ncbi:MAG TPA: two-component regulator propeller domain-containing protein [Saprospiraceae bacterium]|nr:two-component regulator propeller domain-containing protein [Saprospiraceae bacterium]
MKIILLVTLMLTSLVARSAIAVFDIKTLPGINTRITAMGECEQYFWIGTDQGIYRYNKKTGKRSLFNTSNCTLPSNHVTSICCTSSGQTYIGTTAGMLLWDHSTFILLTMENSGIPDNYITALAEDKSGDLWIGTFHGGLVKATSDPIRPYKCRAIKLENENIYSLAINSQGGVWVGFYNGNFACVQNGACEHFEKEQLISSLQASNVPPFLLNTHDQGILVFDGANFQSFDIIPLNSVKMNGCYYNAKFESLFLFYENGVYAYNSQYPFDLRNFEYNDEFIDALSSK